MGLDGKSSSKRNGASGVASCVRQGYFSSRLLQLNFLARLGLGAPTARDDHDAAS